MLEICVPYILLVKSDIYNFSLGIALAQKKVPTAAYNRGSISMYITMLSLLLVIFFSTISTELCPFLYFKFAKCLLSG
jgi:hypothetical protein